MFISPNNVKNNAICNLQIIPQVHASGILTNLVSSTYELLFPPDDYIDENDDFETKTLNIVEISELRARDIKRRLARKHGYDPEELSKMIDKKDLINALSFEEHKSYTREVDRRKWIRFKNTVIYTCAAIIVVMFWPLLKHALEVASVNFVVYTGTYTSSVMYHVVQNIFSAICTCMSFHQLDLLTDRRKHEIRRCHELYSYKGYFGIFILFIIDILSFWLSISVLLSWVMSSKYFFPTPNIPLRPAQLLTPKGHDAGALGQYGINVGPMIIRFAFKFLNDKVESMIGRAMVEAVKREKRREKEILKQMRKEDGQMGLVLVTMILNMILSLVKYIY